MSIRNRTNLFCALVWTFNAGVNLAGHQNLVIGLVAATLAVFYGSSAWHLAKLADKVDKEEREKNAGSGTN